MIEEGHPQRERADSHTREYSTKIGSRVECADHNDVNIYRFCAVGAAIGARDERTLDCLAA